MKRIIIAISLLVSVIGLTIPEAAAVEVLVGSIKNKKWYVAFVRTDSQSLVYFSLRADGNSSSWPVAIDCSNVKYALDSDPFESIVNDGTIIWHLYVELCDGKFVSTEAVTKFTQLANKSPQPRASTSQDSNSVTADLMQGLEQSRTDFNLEQVDIFFRNCENLMMRIISLDGSKTTDIDSSNAKTIQIRLKGNRLFASYPQYPDVNVGVNGAIFESRQKENIRGEDHDVWTYRKDSYFNGRKTLNIVKFYFSESKDFVAYADQYATEGAPNVLHNFKRCNY